MSDVAEGNLVGDDDLTELRIQNNGVQFFYML
jgi:hypothetical protein